MRNRMKFVPRVEVFNGYRALLTIVQGHSEVIWRISDFRPPCILETADHRAKWNKIWTSGVFR